MGKKTLAEPKEDEEVPQPPKELAHRAVGRWQKKITQDARSRLSGHDMECLIDEVAWLLENVMNGTVEVDLEGEENQ